MNNIVVWVYFIGIVYLGTKGIFSMLEDVVGFIRKRLYQKKAQLTEEQLARAKDIFKDVGAKEMWGYITSSLDIDRFVDATVNMSTGQVTYMEVK